MSSQADQPAAAEPALSLQSVPVFGAPVEAYVVFHPDLHFHSLAPWWVRIFTRRGFRHVSALVPTVIGTVVVNPLAVGLTVWWEPHDAADLAKTLIVAGGCRVIRYRGQLPGGFQPRGILTCVSVVKHLLGLQSFWTITPRGLYRLLRGDGIEVEVEP